MAASGVGWTWGGSSDDDVLGCACGWVGSREGRWRDGEMVRRAEPFVDLGAENIELLGVSFRRFRGMGVVVSRG